MIREEIFGQCDIFDRRDPNMLFQKEYSIYQKISQVGLLPVRADTLLSKSSFLFEVNPVLIAQTRVAAYLDSSHDLLL